jgi:hypothetical protein
MVPELRPEGRRSVLLTVPSVLELRLHAVRSVPPIVLSVPEPRPEGRRSVQLTVLWSAPELRLREPRAVQLFIEVE